MSINGREDDFGALLGLNDLMSILVQTRGTILFTLDLDYGGRLEGTLCIYPRPIDSFLSLVITDLLGYMMASDPFTRKNSGGVILADGATTPETIPGRISFNFPEGERK